MLSGNGYVYEKKFFDEESYEKSFSRKFAYNTRKEANDFYKSFRPDAQKVAAERYQIYRNGVKKLLAKMKAQGIGIDVSVDADAADDTNLSAFESIEIEYEVEDGVFFTYTFTDFEL